MQKKTVLNILALRTTILLLAGLLVGGCASTNHQKEISKPIVSKPSINIVSNKPEWLLIGGVDISLDKASGYSYKAESSGEAIRFEATPGGRGPKIKVPEGPYIDIADKITTSRLTGLMNFDIIGTPEISFSFYYGPKIIYWSGNGEITNTKTGERVIVPLLK